MPLSAHSAVLGIIHGFTQACPSLKVAVLDTVSTGSFY